MRINAGDPGTPVESITVDGVDTPNVAEASEEGGWVRVVRVVRGADGRSRPVIRMRAGAVKIHLTEEGRALRREFGYG